MIMAVKNILGWIRWIWNNKINFLKLIDKHSQFIIAVATTIGVIFVVFQIDNIKYQNKVLESTLRQEYRPMANLSFIYRAYLPSSPPQEIFEDNKMAKDDSVFLSIYKYTNNGKGPLIVIGYISFVSYKRLEIHIEPLTKLIEKQSIIFDTIYSEKRFKPVFPSESDSSMVYHKMKSNRLEYYFYNLFLYKDQDNNLYGTIHLIYCRYKNNEDFKKGTEPAVIVINEYFYYFNKEEHIKLLNYVTNIEKKIKKRTPTAQHSLSEAIGKPPFK